jgi:immunity protein 49 of polymorphic toxin system
MASKLLPVIRANALARLATAVPLLQHGKLGENGRFAELVVDLYRTVAICALLHDGSRAAFLENLQKSGAASAFALPRLAKGSVAASKLSGFFSAAACGDLETARAISKAAPDAWSSDLEHEDDFLYTRFLMELFCLGATKSRLQAIAERLGVVTDGEASPRREICEAMLARDAGRFEAGLELWLAERRDFYREHWECDQVTEDEWATDGQVFVEGIALVKLARKLGLVTQPEYLFIPAAVLERDVGNVSLESWRAVGV